MATATPPDSHRHSVHGKSPALRPVQSALFPVHLGLGCPVQAQGYQERRPVYIACADILLRKIEGVGVPVPVERAACAVLLGQVEAAIALLEEGLHGVPEQEGSNGLPVKQEPEAALALDFIRMEAEQADGDYLPGLCAYVERYMGTKVAPKFRMADRKPLEPVSLVDYFGSARVTAYASTVSYPPVCRARPLLVLQSQSTLWRCRSC